MLRIRRTRRIGRTRGGDVLDFGEDVGGILIRTIVVLQGILVAGHKPAARAGPVRHHVAGLFFLDAKLRYRRALIIGLVRTRVVKQFKTLARIEIHNRGRIGKQAG